MSDQKNQGSFPVWLLVGIVLALVAAAVGVASKNAKGNKRYDRLVGAIEDLITEGRAKAEDAVSVIADTGEDLKRSAKKAKRRLG